jgi:hypothetical protein
VEPVGETTTEADAEEVEEALECEWWCLWMDRIEETDDDVDLRPRRPVELRR